jgi:hypothetical protein
VNKFVEVDDAHEAIVDRRTDESYVNDADSHWNQVSERDDAMMGASRRVAQAGVHFDEEWNGGKAWASI